MNTSYNIIDWIAGSITDDRARYWCATLTLSTTQSMNTSANHMNNTHKIIDGITVSKTDDRRKLKHYVDNAHTSFLKHNEIQHEQYLQHRRRYLRPHDWWSTKILTLHVDTARTAIVEHNALPHEKYSQNHQWNHRIKDWWSTKTNASRGQWLHLNH